MIVFVLEIISLVKNFRMVVKCQFTLVFLFFIISAFGQPKDTILGNVESIREKVTFTDSNRQNGKLTISDGDYGHSGYINSKWTKDRFFTLWYQTPYVHYINYHKKFNKNGKVHTEEWYYKNGDRLVYYNYVYDNENNMIQIIQELKKDTLSTSNYTYNSKKDITTKLYYVKDEPNLYVYYLYRYDSISNLVKVKRFNSEGESSSRIYQYDYKNRLITDLRFKSHRYVQRKNGVLQLLDSNSVKRVFKKYKYNANDKVVEIQTFDSSNSNYDYSSPTLIQNKIYLNEMLREEQHIRDTLIYKIEYNYDNKSRLLKKRKTSIKNPRYNQLLEYKYDGKGNLEIVTFTENSITNVMSFEYNFDEHANWIKQSKSVDGKELYIWTRDINYYD